MKDKVQKIMFFLGKGGVGKSTTSSLYAVEKSLTGEKVLLASMDPAHNLGDIFEMRMSGKPKTLSKTLSVAEINLDYWVNHYLDDMQKQMTKSYSYLTALSLDKHFGIVRYSPGIEEYALLRAFSYFLTKYTEFDRIIFDMPPTGLTLKFLSLPKLSQIWLEKLVDLRNDIIAKKEIVTKIKFGNIEIERDKLLNKLNNQLDEYSGARKILEDRDRTELVLVMNQDKLSLAESKLIVDKLKFAELKVKKVFINKFKVEIPVEELETIFQEYEIRHYPSKDESITGLDNLEKYLRENNFITE
jgi:arsenite-transporting ATPase